MTTKLIILRGNSGSGKSTVARELQQRMGHGTALIEQDYIRRTLLREKDRPNQPNIELITLNAQFALEQNYNVILEGILHEKHYGAMLRELLSKHAGSSHVYYFDIPLEETIRRHQTKPNAHEFGEKELRSWYTPQDILQVNNEQTITKDHTLKAVIDRIISDVT